MAFILVLIFSACGISEQIPDESASENESSSLEEEPNSVPSGAEDDNSASDIIDRIYEIAEKNLTYYAENAHWLEAAGISQKAANVAVYDDGTLSFDLTLEKDGKEITENIRGFWLYYSEEYDSNLNWGGYSFTNNGYIAVCGTDQLFLIDLSDFSLSDIEFDLSSQSGDETDLWINGVAYDETNENWIVSAAEAYPGFLFESDMRGYIFVFDEEGKFIRKYEPKPSAIYGGWLDFATPSVAYKCGVIQNGGKTYYSFGSRSYCVEDGKTYSGSATATPYNAKTEGYSVYFYHCYDIDNASVGYLSSGEDLGYYAVLKDSDENILNFFPTGENYMDVTWDRETGEQQTLELTHHGNLRFTLKNSYLAKNMELDFTKCTYTVEYNYTEANLSEHIATSSDGKYSLWRAGIQTGGEAYFYEVALKDNTTGKITHIASGGTNTGSFSSEGFLKNGDFYVFSSSGLKIYGPETAEMIFDIGENFPLENRLLYTFRRDPDDFSYILVYAECTAEEIAEGYSSEDYPYIMPFCLRVAYLDSEGKLIKSFESGINARADFFGLENIDMRYSANELLFITGGGKGYSGQQFTFDRRTETFSEAEDIE